MKLVRTVAMPTDHSYHGHPIETSRVELWVNEDHVTPEQIEILKRLQDERLHSMAKRMPHRYWLHRSSTSKDR